MTVYSADWVLPVEGEPIRDGAVAVEDGRIAAVGPASELGAGRRFECAAIVPGFVNAHAHLEYAVYAGFGEGLDFGPWIRLHIERKARIGYEEMRAIARLGVAECLRSAITTVADSSYSGATAEAAADLGLRAVVYVEVFGHRREDLAAFHETADRIAPALSDRVRLGVGPHAPYSVAPELFEACLELGVPVTTHLAESDDETEWLLHGTGAFEPLAPIYVGAQGVTGARLLARHGLLAAGLLAAHCVKLDADEIALVAEHGVTVAHCPRSNALLGCGIAPLRELREAGVAVGLGTDGVSSVPSYDFFDELRTAVCASRAREERAEALTTAEALELATLGSARALGLDGEVGSLVPGKHADLAIVSLERSPFLPWEDPVTAVVFGGSPERVLLTVVGGETRYEKGVNEWHELTGAASRARGRMLAADPAPAR